MKLSEFIIAFESAISAHGDLEVYFLDDYDTAPLPLGYPEVEQMRDAAAGRDEDESLPDGKAMFLNVGSSNSPVE